MSAETLAADQRPAVAELAARLGLDPDRGPMKRWGVPLAEVTPAQAAELLAALQERQAAAEPMCPADQPPAEPADRFAHLRPWPHLYAWRNQLEARRPGDPVPPCPTPAADPDGRPYGTAYCERLAAETRPPMTATVSGIAHDGELIGDRA